MPNSNVIYIEDTIRVNYPDGPVNYKAIQASPTSNGTGPDISDATATAADIRKPKTAYVATGKVVGTIETYTGATGNV